MTLRPVRPMRSSAWSGALPAAVRHPRLHVREGRSLEPVTELLPGDEESLLHAPVTHAVPIDG